MDTSKLRGMTFKPFSKLVFWVFVANFLALMYLGGKHVETPFIELGQLCTFLYFAWFILLVPATGILENTMTSLRSSLSESPKPL